LLAWTNHLRAAEVVGRVSDAHTGQSLAGATVRAIPLTRSQREVQARTNREGRYQLELLRGKYRLFASLAGTNYLPKFYSASGQPSGDVLDVATFESFRILDIALEAGGSIRGTVRRAVDLRPLSSVRIQAISKSSRTATTTRSDGSYVFQGLPPDNYRLQVLALDDNFISHYYGDTRDLEEATVISLNRQQEVTGIDFRLEYGGVIGGRAYASKNREPIAGLRIIAENQTRQEPPFFTITDSQGFFTLQGLTQGLYTVETQPGKEEGSQSRQRKAYVMQFHEDRYDRELADKLEVVPGSVFTGINFAMVEGASISGTVRSRYHSRPLSQVLLRTQSVAKTVLKPLQGVSDGEGNFLIENLPPGDYVLDTSVPEAIQRIINSFYHDKLSLETADRVTLAEGEKARHIDFDLPMGGTIRGSLKVQDSDYALAPAGKSVSLKRQGPDREGFGRKQFKLKPDGSFLLERTPPGQYTLTPVLDDPNLIPQANAQEKIVEVAEGSLIDGVEFPLDVVGSISGTVTAQGKNLDLSRLVLMVIKSKDNSRSYFDLPSEKYTVAGLEPGKYMLVLMTRPESTPTEFGLSKGQILDMRFAEVQRGKTTEGVVLQVPVDPNFKPSLFP
jgi:hypothetical protein